MHIECVTHSAAGQVVLVLMAARLRPGLDFRVDDPTVRARPTRFSLHVGIPPHVVRQLHGISGASIENERAG